MTSGGAIATGPLALPSRPTVQQGEKAAREALALWAHFPAGRRPRPIVIPAGPGIVVAPRNQSEDLALYQANWTFTPARAADVATARSHGWVSPATAITALRNGLKHAPAATSTLTVRALLGRASFVSDRGIVPVPAWQFFFRHYRQPASVLAVIPFNSPPLRNLDPNGIGNSQDGEQAIVSPDGRTLTISFVGGHAGKRPCDDNYTAETVESTHAVAFAVYEHPAPAPPNTACTLVGYERTVVVHLTQPLDNRVVVDSRDGGAIPAATHSTFRY